MSKTVLKVDNLSKQYRLGLVGTSTLSHDLNRWWTKLRGKDDPYLKIGDTNDRSSKGNSDYVWALKDINFDVKQGEVLGIIGKNGAGKSTLLKILSKVTGPTTGVIKTKGRIASLLEVGTGFHPELTGSENIFLNGAILGMTRSEIKQKFDEIVDFSGVERYIDTPVKRYSSGMRVRLAFAVAAHLEPEILIVDEVLAVGDADFQKKAIGKMQDVSKGEGRTVLFVSHNMTAVKNLCNSCILLENGMIKNVGLPEEIVSEYLDLYSSLSNSITWKNDEMPTKNGIALKRIEAFSTDAFDIAKPVSIQIEFESKRKIAGMNITLHLLTTENIHVFNSGSPISEIKKGQYLYECQIPGNLFNAIRYKINLLFVEKARVIFMHKEVISFGMQENREISWFGKRKGVMYPRLDWRIETLEVNKEAKYL